MSGLVSKYGPKYVYFVLEAILLSSFVVLYLIYNAARFGGVSPFIYKLLELILNRGLEDKLFCKLSISVLKSKPWNGTGSNVDIKPSYPAYSPNTSDCLPPFLFWPSILLLVFASSS